MTTKEKGPWEVFDPRDGKALFTVRTAAAARFAVWRFRRSLYLDYAPKGKGWLR